MSTKVIWALYDIPESRLEEQYCVIRIIREIYTFIRNKNGAVLYHSDYFITGDFAEYVHGLRSSFDEIDVFILTLGAVSPAGCKFQYKGYKFNLCILCEDVQFSKLLVSIGRNFGLGPHFITYVGDKLDCNDRFVRAEIVDVKPPVDKNELLKVYSDNGEIMDTLQNTMLCDYMEENFEGLVVYERPNPIILRRNDGYIFGRYKYNNIPGFPCKAIFEKRNKKWDEDSIPESI